MLVAVTAGGGLETSIPGTTSNISVLTLIAQPCKGKPDTSVPLSEQVNAECATMIKPRDTNATLCHPFSAPDTGVCLQEVSLKAREPTSHKGVDSSGVCSPLSLFFTQKSFLGVLLLFLALTRV